MICLSTFPHQHPPVQFQYFFQAELRVQTASGAVNGKEARGTGARRLRMITQPNIEVAPVFPAYSLPQEESV